MANDTEQQHQPQQQQEKEGHKEEEEEGDSKSNHHNNNDNMLSKKDIVTNDNNNVSMDDKCDESDGGNSKKIRRHRRGKWRRPRWRTNYKSDSLDQHQQHTHHHRNHHQNHHRRFCSFKIRNLIDHPLAPFNTNQFLMDDHDVRMPEHDHSDETTLQQSNGDDMTIDKDSAECTDSSTHGHRRRCNSDCTSNRQESQECSSDEINSLPDEEYDFMQKQFSETYEKIHSERINSMSKAQLVEEYLLLERRCEQLEMYSPSADQVQMVPSFFPC